jgi:hypothetical protein
MAKNGTLAKIHELQPSFQTTTEQITIRATTADQQSRQQATPLPCWFSVLNVYWDVLVRTVILNAGARECSSGAVIIVRNEPSWRLLENLPFFCSGCGLP